jgi:hypothetical protein
MLVGEHRPLRTIGIASGAVGAFAVESSGVSGPWAVVGGVLLSVALAAFDALGRGRIGRRQAGLAVTALAAALGTWAGAVTIFLTLLELPVESNVTVLLGGSLCALAAGVLLLRTGLEESAEAARIRTAGSSEQQRRDA